MIGIWRLTVATVLSMVPMAMLLPLIAVTLMDRGRSASEVGLFAALGFASLLALTPFTPAIRKRLGSGPTYRLGIALGTVAVILFVGGDGFWLWSLANVVVGLAAALIWGTPEGLIAEIAPKARLGRVTGLYQTAIAAAAALGPALPATFDLDLEDALSLALLLQLLAWAPMFGLALPKAAAETEGAATTPWSGLARLAPPVIAMALLAGLFESGLNAMAPVHGLALGFAPTVAAMITAIIAAGSLIGQYPTGALADRARDLNVARIATILLALSGLALPAAAFAPALIWPLAAIWGGIGGGLYTLAMIRVGRSFEPTDIPRATAIVIATYTLGALAGPALAGLAMDRSPAYGLAVLLVLSCAIVLATLRPARTAALQRWPSRS